MSLGVVRTIGSLIEEFRTGDIFYPLNSLDQLVVLLVFDGGVITTNGEYFAPHRPVRWKEEWVDEFPIDWQAIADSKDYQIEIPEFTERQYYSGISVIFLSEDLAVGRVEVLVGCNPKKQVYKTESGLLIPFSESDRIMSLEVNEDFLDEESDEE